MSVWLTGVIGDYGKVVTGSTPPTKHTEYYDGPYLFVTPSDLSYDSYFINTAERTISETGHAKFAPRFVPKNSVMYTCIASIGKIGISNSDILTNQQINTVIPNTNTDGRFIYYLLRYITPNIQQQNAGSAVPIINKSDFENIGVPLVPLSEQRRIVGILSAYDNLIENNRKRIAILEEIARLDYRKRFGEKNQIRSTTLEEILDAIESGSRPKGGAATEGVPSIGAEKIESIGVYDFSSEKYVSREYYEKMRRGKVRSGDVLLYKDGAYAGKASMALNGFPHVEAAVNEHVFILRTHNLNAQCFLYCFLKQAETYEQLNTIASAKSCQPGLNQSDVLNLEIKLPSEDAIAEFERKAIVLFEAIVNLSKQNAVLAAARDALLPRLMKGDLKWK